MRLSLIHREKLQALGSYLVSELDNLVARIRTGWNVEHNEDGEHTHVHAETISTGRVVYASVVADSISLTQHNYDPGFDTASVLRVTPEVDGVKITGLKVPQDETGAVLDGRVLILENHTETGKALILCHELSADGQGSFARNRFRLPRQPLATNAITEFVVHPSMFVTLIYNATKARWIIASASIDNTSAFQAFATSQNDFTFGTSPRAMRTWRLIPEAEDLYITGFTRDQLPEDEKKTVVNDGEFTLSLLHAHVNSSIENRIYCPGGVRYLLHPRESVEIQYIRGGNGGWRILSKADQWIDVAYNAGNFSAGGGSSPTWVVGSGDHQTLCYQIDGNKMTVSFHLTGTSITGSPTFLHFPIPDGRTSARFQTLRLTAYDGSGPQSNAIAQVNPGGSAIFFFSEVTGAVAWTDVTNGAHILGTITFMIRDDCGSISEAHTDVAHADDAHTDAEHTDVAHVDVIHVDTHGDTAHSDSSHSDVAHSDTHSDVAHTDVAHVDFNHIDTHEDDAHDDAAHSDTHSDVAHDDSHSDVAHSDSHSDAAHDDQHSDVAHVDEHADSHSDHDDFDHIDFHLDTHDDTAHTDTHGDTAHEDSHGDDAHSDSHSDVAHDDTHSDVAHQDDPHDDTHTDFAHADTPHEDVSHNDAHSDVSHSDGAHSDTAHADSHSDTPHSDTAHTDAGHTDAPHGDSAHEDVGLHCDTSHVDM